MRASLRLHRALPWPPHPLPQGAPQATPTLRVTTRLVQVSVIVHDKKGEPVSGDELQAIADAKSFEVRPGDVALVRTGYMSHWPDPERLAAHRTPGP